MSTRKSIPENEKTAAKYTKAQEKERLERIRVILFFCFIGISIIVGIVASITKYKTAERRSLIATLGKPTVDSINMNMDGIGFIELDGVITSEKSRDFFGSVEPSIVDALANAFEYYAENRNAKAIVISINSPGGSVVACDEAYTRMKRAIEENPKPVIVVFRDIAASGGYYLAMVGDEIYASEGTLTGSIGVILQTLNFKGLMDRYGVRSYSFTTGQWKDSLSPFGDVSSVEEAYFTELVDSMFGNFTNKVLDGRGDRLIGSHNELFDGRIFSGIMASEFGLVDGIATVDEAISRAAKVAGLSNTENPHIVPYIEKGGMDITSDLLRKFLSNKSSIFDMFFNPDSIKSFANIKSTIGVEELQTKYQGIPMFLYPNTLYTD